MVNLQYLTCWCDWLVLERPHVVCCACLTCKFTPNPRGFTSICVTGLSWQDHCCSFCISCLKIHTKPTWVQPVLAISLLYFVHVFFEKSHHTNMSYQARPHQTQRIFSPVFPILTWLLLTNKILHLSSTKCHQMTPHIRFWHYSPHLNGEPGHRCPHVGYNSGANLLSLPNHHRKHPRYPNVVGTRKRGRAKKRSVSTLFSCVNKSGNAASSRL